MSVSDHQTVLHALLFNDCCALFDHSGHAICICIYHTCCMSGVLTEQDCTHWLRMEVSYNLFA